MLFPRLLLPVSHWRNTQSILYLTIHTHTHTHKHTYTRNTFSKRKGTGYFLSGYITGAAVEPFTFASEVSRSPGESPRAPAPPGGGRPSPVSVARRIRNEFATRPSRRVERVKSSRVWTERRRKMERARSFGREKRPEYIRARRGLSRRVSCGLSRARALP